MRRSLALALILSVAVAPGVASVRVGAGSDAASGFGVGGIVQTDFGRDDAAVAVAIQRDGRILAAGTSGGDFALARFETDGRLDPSFGRGGKIVTDFGGHDQAAALVIQPDGKIIVAGAARAAGRGGQVKPPGGHLAVARYTTRGRLDPSFGSRGKVVSDVPGGRSPFGNGDAAQAVALQRDGKIVVSGRSGDKAAVVRYGRDGRADTMFGKRGAVFLLVSGFDSNDAPTVAVQPDGKVVVSVRGFYKFTSSSLVRLTRAGTRDRGFGNAGWVKFPIRSNNSINAIAIQPDGRILAAGFAELLFNPYPFPSGLALSRFTRAGGLDRSFRSGAAVRRGLGAALAVGLDEGGRIVTAGYREIVRHLPDGRIDASFGVGGKVSTPSSARPFEGVGLAIQQDGKIVVAGSIGPARKRDFLVARYTVDGKLDT